MIPNYCYAILLGLTVIYIAATLSPRREDPLALPRYRYTGVS